MALSERSKSKQKRWSVLGLRRVEGLVDAKSIVLIREIGGAGVRVWFQNFMDDEEWTRMKDLLWDNGVLRIEFPDDKFTGFPACLILEIPKQERLGGTWTLRLQDGAVAAILQLRSTDEISEVGLAELEDSYRARQRPE